MKKMYTLLFFQFLLPIFSFSAEGFKEGTLVHTTSGFIPIEQLAIDDAVMCYNFQTQSYTESQITRTSRKETSTIIAIAIGDNVIHADHDQLFYIPAEKQWCRACNLKVGDILLQQNGQNCCISDIQTIHQPATVFDITVDRYHNFCVSEKNIVSHNFIIALPILAWGGAGGLTLFEGVTIASIASATAAALFYATVEHTTGIETNNEVNLNGTVNGQPLPFAHEPEHIHNNRDNTIVTGTSTGPGGPCWCGHLCGIGCGCLCPCGCSSQHANKAPQNNTPNNLHNNEETNKSQRFSFTYDAIEEGVKYAMTDSKRKHIFENPEHKLDTLVTKLGGQENTIRAVIHALNNEILFDGIHKDLQINVAGYALYVRLRIMDGIPKIGTLFIK